MVYVIYVIYAFCLLHLPINEYINKSINKQQKKNK